MRGAEGPVSTYSFGAALWRRDLTPPFLPSPCPPLFLKKATHLSFIERRRALARPPREQRNHPKNHPALPVRLKKHSARRLCSPCLPRRCLRTQRVCVARAWQGEGGGWRQPPLPPSSASPALSLPRFLTTRAAPPPLPLAQGRGAKSFDPVLMHARPCESVGLVHPRGLPLLLVLFSFCGCPPPLPFVFCFQTAHARRRAAHLLPLKTTVCVCAFSSCCASLCAPPTRTPLPRFLCTRPHLKWGAPRKEGPRRTRFAPCAAGPLPTAPPLWFLLPLYPLRFVFAPRAPPFLAPSLSLSLSLASQLFPSQAVPRRSFLKSKAMGKQTCPPLLQRLAT